MIVKIISTILLLLAIFMGVKNGWYMFTARHEMLQLFGKWNFSKNAVIVNGFLLLIAAGLLVFPKTFVWGNFLMAAIILLIMCMQLSHQDLKGVIGELPFFALNLILLYWQHPLSNMSRLK